MAIIAVGGGSLMVQKSFGSVATAKKWAKTEANRTGVSTIIYNSKPGKKTKTHHVGPDKKKNPTASIPRNKWVNAKIRVTSSGKIQAKVSSGSLKQNQKRKRAAKKRR